MHLEGTILPAPRLRLISWLSSPAQPLGPDVAAQLRMSMFRRLEAVLVSAVVTLTIAVAVASTHPIPSFLLWVALDVVVMCVRVPVVLHIRRRLAGRAVNGLLARWAPDLFIITGTLWSAVLGYGCLLTLSTAGSGVSSMVPFVGMAIVAAQSMRNPSSPRMNAVQMGLILLPLAAGDMMSPAAPVRWAATLWPVYYLTMITLTRQIHDDYVAMIVAQAENRKRALHCALTGLPNRIFFQEHLCAALRQAAVAREAFAVLCVDLDGFKQVNDQFGHPLGDALLIQVAGRIKDLLRSTDSAARLGGDEFAVLLRSANRRGIESVAARINHVMALPFDLGPQGHVTIGASVGIKIVDGGPDAALVDAGWVMAHADQALYAAKRAGKGTFRQSETTSLTDNAVATPILRLVG